jgi:hypothetical protein
MFIKCVLCGLMVINTMFGCADIVASRHVALDSPYVVRNDDGKFTYLSYTTDAGYYFLPLVKVRLTAQRGAPRFLIDQAPSQSTVKKSQQAGASDQEAGASDKGRGPSETNESGKHATTEFCVIQLGEEITEPDPNFLFTLTPENSRFYFYDDDVTVSVTPNGLLSAINLTSTDQTGTVAVKVATLAKEIAKAASGLTGRDVEEEGKEERVAREPFYFSQLVDPLNEKDLADFNAKLMAEECDLLVGIKPLASNLTVIEPDVSKRAGVFHRPLLPYTLYFSSSEQKQDGNESAYVEHHLYLPNRAPILAIDLERASFVKIVHGLKFKDGVLTEVRFSRPSSASAFLDIPIGIAKDIVSIPAELFQLKLNLSNEDKQMLDAQKGLVEAQKNLLKEQEELRQMRESLERHDDSYLQRGSFTK